jgi:predicted dehydrogenase
MKTVSIVQVAIGGYGGFYVSAYLDNDVPGIEVVGVVDPHPEGCERLDELKAANIPVFDSLDAFYAERGADIAVLASPIQYHLPQTKTALANGSHVLCEKPLGATVQEVGEMIAARDAAQLSVAIGYQKSFSIGIQQLKADMMAGRFGAPRRLKTIALWPRAQGYYDRNNWAGKMRDSAGNWVLDSPANNAAAHYLHNMLYLLGPKVDRSAKPVAITAELYRANQIPGFDTVATRIQTDCGAEVLFYSSHAADGGIYGPAFEFEFEEGLVTHISEGEMTAHSNGSIIETYGDVDSDICKIEDIVRVAREGGTPLCGPEAAGAHTLCINGMHESMPEIQEFAPERIGEIYLDEERTPSQRVLEVAGLGDVMHSCFRNGMLPAEQGVEWAVAGNLIDISNYTNFPKDPAAFI